MCQLNVMPLVFIFMTFQYNAPHYNKRILAFFFFWSVPDKNTIPTGGVLEPRTIWKYFIMEHVDLASGMAVMCVAVKVVLLI